MAAWRSALRPWFWPALIVLCGFGAYFRTLDAPFVFDDGLAVRENLTIQSLTDLGRVLDPPANGSGVSGRPLVNLSLAINYAMGGLNPRGYHLFNVVAHGLVGLLLFVVLRRTFRLPRLNGRFGPVAEGLAGMAALWWVLHPLQTESVASVVQRTEILVSVFFLATLYGLIRAADQPQSRLWPWGAVLACGAGMATKEIMFVAPIFALLYDRALLAGTFSAAWRQRRTLYLGLGASWVILAYLVYKMGGTRGAAAGFGTGEITWWSYFFKQWEAIIHYLQLTVWPHPLVVDYGMDVIWDITEVAGRGATLVVLGLLTVWGLRRNALWALVGAWFFLILGPSSSVMPLAAQTMAEHRMYLPLAALGAGAVALLYAYVGRWLWVVGGGVALSWGAVTYARTLDYATEERLWVDTVAKRPRNERAHYNLAGLLLNAGRYQEAYRKNLDALAVEPRYVGPRVGLANCMFRLGRVEEAIREYRKALKQDPNSFEARSNLGVALCEIGKFEEGTAELLRILAVKPDFTDAHFNLGTVLLRAGLLEPAEKHYREAIRLRPTFAEAYNNLGATLLRTGRKAEAAEHFRLALRHKPEYTEARNNLEAVLRAP